MMSNADNGGGQMSVEEAAYCLLALRYTNLLQANGLRYVVLRQAPYLTIVAGDDTVPGVELRIWSGAREVGAVAFGRLAEG